MPRVKDRNSGGGKDIRKPYERDAHNPPSPQRRRRRTQRTNVTRGEGYSDEGGTVSEHGAQISDPPRHRSKLLIHWRLETILAALSVVIGFMIFNRYGEQNELIRRGQRPTVVYVAANFEKVPTVSGDVLAITVRFKNTGGSTAKEMELNPLPEFVLLDAKTGARHSAIPAKGIGGQIPKHGELGAGTYLFLGLAMDMDYWFSGWDDGSFYVRTNGAIKYQDADANEMSPARFCLLLHHHHGMPPSIEACASRATEENNQPGNELEPGATAMTRQGRGLLRQRKIGGDSCPPIPVVAR